MTRKFPRFPGSIVTAIVSGLVCLFVASAILAHLGETYHGSYEYYGEYIGPAPFLIPGIVGFFLPSPVAWILRKAGWRKEQ